LAATIVQPLIGLTAALIAGPWGALENQTFGPGVPESAQLLLLFALLAWLGHALLFRRPILPVTPLNRPLLGFLGVVGLSLLGAASTRLGIIETVKWVELGLVMAMVVDLSGLARGRRVPADRFRWLVAAVLAGAVIQALIGIWQFGLRGEGPDHFLIGDRFYRAFGTFQQPNPFGGFMGLAAAVALGALLGWAVDYGRRMRSGQRPASGEWLWLLFLAGAAGLTSLALVMSWSRGAWLGFGAAVATIAVFLPRRRIVGLLLLAGAILLLWGGSRLGLIPASVTGRLASFSEDFRIGDVRGVDFNEANFAVVERLAHWQAALDMARERPWLGFGFGNYEAAYPRFALINWEHPLGHAHNYYLNILAETGVVGLAAYLLFWCAVTVQAVRAAGRVGWPARGILLGLLGAWAALSVHQLVDKLYVNNLYLFMGALLGLQQVAGRVNDRSDR
jgi:O-antigen ligase